MSVAVLLAFAGVLRCRGDRESLDIMLKLTIGRMGTANQRNQPTDASCVILCAMLCLTPSVMICFVVVWITIVNSSHVRCSSVLCRAVGRFSPVRVL